MTLKRSRDSVPDSFAETTTKRRSAAPHIAVSDASAEVATTSEDSAEVATSGTSEEESTSPETRILYCLDFDGVLCDSVHETFLSGFKACKILWKNSVWIKVLEDNNEKLKDLEADFRYVRPILYVGWEAILLISLLAVGCPPEITRTSLKTTHTTSTREVVFQRFHAPGDGVKSLRDFALDSWGFTEDEYKAAMSEARTTWIRDDEASWINAHGFFPGACTAVWNHLCARGNSDVYVITTKAKEFALRLLEKQDLFQSTTNDSTDSSDKQQVENQYITQQYLQESHVFGLGSGPKASVLQKILEHRQSLSSSTKEVFRAIMVEDNVATLDKISKSPVGNKVLPVVVPWGYNSVEQLEDVLLTKTSSAQAESNPPFVVLPLHRKDKFLGLPPECTTLKQARREANRAKRIDPNGDSLAVVFKPTFGAGNLFFPTQKRNDKEERIGTKNQEPG